MYLSCKQEFGVSFYFVVLDIISTAFDNPLLFSILNILQIHLFLRGLLTLLSMIGYFSEKG